MPLVYTENPSVLKETGTNEFVEVSNRNQRYIELLKQYGPPVPYFYTEPTSADVIEEQFPQDGVTRVLFEALFEIANRLQALEGKQSITREQLKNWLISKLPPPTPQIPPPIP